jgi:hypothetical protein
MIEIKKGLLWVKTTLKNSFQKAIEKVLVGIIVAIFIIAVLLLWEFSEVIMMLLSSEVAVFWLFVIVILSSVVVGIIHHTKTKKYNELFKKTKPPYSIDGLIKAGPKYNPNWNVGIEGDPPHLIFYIRVVNRTNYYFTPKKAFLTCYSYYPKNLVFKEEWEDEARSQHIYPSDLKKLEDGEVQFHVPKEKIDDNARVFKIKGHVEYTTEEDIIHEDHRKSVKVPMVLEYKLDEETTPEPKGRVIIAK